MKHLYRILICLVAALSAFACGDDESGERIATQQNNIRTYIMRMQDFDAAEFMYDDSVYIYSLPVPEDPQWTVDRNTVAASADEVSFTYTAYEFTTAPATYPFTTNDPSVIDELVEAGIWDRLDDRLWSREPYVATIGTTRLLPGIAKALPGRYKGESFLLFLTDDKAYDGASVPGLNNGSAVMFDMRIDDIKKQ